jgi:murein DD-endopeptidase MepM/ murein hydrolase activator NlpD
MKKTTLLLCLLPFTFGAQAAIKEDPVPGGIKTLRLNSAERPIVMYEGKRVAIKKTADGYEAIIGIPLDTKIAPQTVQQTQPTKKTFRFNISQKPYRVQKLTIKNKRKVTPLAVDEKRINDEADDFQKTLGLWQHSSPFAKPFVAPLRGPITSTFGLKRVYNGIPKAPHTALDIYAPSGEPVIAVNDGQVVNIHHRFFTGNTVIIDHGQGVMSLYAHLSAFKVKNGQKVKRGDVIGLVGKTGRVTGPHLHWAMYLNQTPVNPLLFVSKQDILPKKVKKQ